MKVKGISFFEQHVEKFVLAAAVLLALFFAAMQFLGRNEIEISGEKLPAARIDAALEERAEALSERLDEDAAPEVEAPRPPQTLAWFQSALGDPLAPEQELVLSFHPAPTLRLGSTPVGGEQLFVEPQLAGVSTPFVEQHADALDPSVVETLLAEENANVVPEEFRQKILGAGDGTYDIVWNTVAALVDIEALLEQLAVEDPDGDRLQIPSRWYDGRIYGLDVVVEREQFENGGWTNRQPVDVLPLGPSPSLRSELNEDMKVGRMDVLKGWLREKLENQASIVQPDFYATVGSSWTAPQPPAEEEEEDPRFATIRKVQRNVATIQEQRDRLWDELEGLGGPLEEERGGSGRGSGSGSGGGGSLPPPGGGGGPPPGGGGGGVDLGNEGGSSGRTSPEERTKARRILLTRQIRSIDTVLDRRKAELQALADAAGYNLNPEGEQRQLPNLETDSSILIWAHDVMIQPHETYRYRITFAVYNPFFGRSSFLVSEQQPLSRLPYMTVATTDWSRPVTVEPLTRFYVTRAQPDDGALGMGQATVEVYRLYDGQWLKQTWTLQPGDPIGEPVEIQGPDGERRVVDFSTNAFLGDVLRQPGDGGQGGIGGAKGRALIVMPDQMIVRDPDADTSNPERLELEASAGTTLASR